MGLVPPFSWEDVETFEGDVACTGILLSTSYKAYSIFQNCNPIERAKLIPLIKLKFCKYILKTF